MISFYEFEKILEENKMLDKVRVGLKRAGEKVDKFLGDNPHQRQADNRRNNKDRKEFDKILGDLAKESYESGSLGLTTDEEEREEVRRKLQTGEIKPARNRVKDEGPKNAPHGKRNAECSRCGNKEKAKLYDINAGKAKCKNCGGYLNLIS